VGREEGGVICQNTLKRLKPQTVTLGVLELDVLGLKREKAHLLERGGVKKFKKKIGLFGREISGPPPTMEGGNDYSEKEAGRGIAYRRKEGAGGVLGKMSRNPGSHPRDSRQASAPLLS